MLAALAAILPIAALATSSPPDWSSETGGKALSWSGAEKLAWSDSFGTPDTDWANRIIELRDGSVVAAGFLNRPGPGSAAETDVVLRKYGPGGRLLWSRRFGGSRSDAAWTVKALPDGRLALAGISSSESAGGNDAYLAVTRPDGHPIFERRYGGPGDDRATDLVLTPDGGFLLVGQTEPGPGEEPDIFLVRADKAGREVWRKSYGDKGSDRGFFAAAAAAGGFVVAGVTGPRGNYDHMLMKVDEQGRLLWRRVVGGGGNDPNHGLAVLPDGRIVFTGYTQSWGSSVHDISILTYSPDGTLLSHQLVGGPGDDRAQSSAAAPDGSVWIVGYTKSFGRGDWDIAVAKVDPKGRLQPWMAAVGTPSDDHGSSISVARNGDLLLSGYTTAPSAGAAPPDGFVIRLKPSRLRRITDGVAVRTGVSPGGEASTPSLRPSAP